ncbi:thiamine-phosphate kinase [Tsuneonella sp. YG55]|uniref:Thiamine-monophosphate kinase n=1 Tax=Tsuneonella litorea TaxID=2976475 RepID=A0A9X3A808_9SPHN|nr:thiamine-phosphate kinase [Tsuneonella litorea]MCT2558991.1 thiamine-phosphate kinase [Tsuneonella litorea]
MSGEAAFIDALRRIATHPAARGLADDAAVLDIGGETLVLTHDAMVEGVHWLPGQDMADVAWKLVAVNLSDLAAKGAEPLGVLLGHMLGGDEARFLEGLADVLGEYGVPLLGGDTVAGGPPLALGLTALGRATFRPVPARSGARPGDEVWLAGTIGGAMTGFEALRDATGADSEAYRRPRPLLAEGRALAPRVTAMLDVSDGLLLDAARIAEASAVTVDLAPMNVPLAAPQDRRADALRWGDDYALLFTLPPGTPLPVPASRIGNVLPRGAEPLLLDGTAVPPERPLGYLHGR